MKLSRGLRMFAAVLPAVALQVASGCSSSRSESLATAEAPIIGGVADNTNLWAVGISIGGGAICSGTMIAPNLVLTARHCVSQTPRELDCRPDGGINTNKIIGNYPASSFRVTTAQRVGGSPQWTVRAVRYLEDPKANTLCGYDLALLELNKNSAGAFPTAWMPPSLIPPNMHKYVAIGYGCQSAEKLGGGGCEVSGYRMLLEPVQVVDITPQEFAIAGRVCGGDSGGPVWNKSKNIVYGALSRGDGTTSEGEGCNFGIYTRTDAHLAWLQKYGKMAAANGGYATLPWMTDSPPPPDAGPPPPVKEPIGSPCSGPETCLTNVCVDFGGDKRCSAVCSDTKPCPTGFECNGGYCQASVPVEDTGPVEEPLPEDDAGVGVTPASDVVKGGTCTVTSFPPPRPQPWLALGAVGLALALLRRRAK